MLEGGGGLLRVPSAGGTPARLTQIDRARHELSHQWPRVLADGKTVLFTIWFGTVEQAQLAAVSLDDRRVTRLGITGAKALGVVDGHLLFVNADGVIMAQPFDARRLRATEVLSDSRVTPAERARLDGLAAALRISPAVARETFIQTASVISQSTFDGATSDRRLSPEEFQHFSALAKEFGITPSFDSGTLKTMDRILALLENRAR